MPSVAIRRRVSRWYVLFFSFLSFPFLSPLVLFIFYPFSHLHGDPRLGLHIYIYMYRRITMATISRRLRPRNNCGSGGGEVLVD